MAGRGCHHCRHRPGGRILGLAIGHRPHGDHAFLGASVNDFLAA